MSPRPAVIGQVTNSLASRARADDVDRVLEQQTRRYDGPAASGLPAAWAECDLVVSHLALGATTRILAPLLQAKKTDPGVVVLDEGGHFVVPLLGGHARAANDLAVQIAEGIGATAVVTTATDATGVPALDTLGWPFAGDVAGVTRAILDGAPVDLDNPGGWPLPTFGEHVMPKAADAVARVRVTDQRTDTDSQTDTRNDSRPGHSVGDTGHADTQADPGTGGTTADIPTVVLHPPSLVVGMGCHRDAPVETLRAHLDSVLGAHRLSPASVTCLVSVDAKADEPGLRALADQLGVPLRTYPADLLDAIDVPHPSEAPAKAVGTRSVAEASVIAAGARIVVGKHKGDISTVAVGRIGPRGRLAVVGLGPGAADLLTPRARDRVTGADAVVGYTVYVDQVRHLLRPGTHVVASGMGTEESRARTALDLARSGRTVALVCSGDPAIYAMASPTLQVAALAGPVSDSADPVAGTTGSVETTGGGTPVDVEIVPGVTASLASSAILGAPLGHDHLTLSLSDLHTSWEAIERRAVAAAQGDVVTVLYNPRSKTRTWQLPRVLEIMAQHRPPTTPVAVVENASRPDERVVTGTLADFDPQEVTMFGMVVIGSSTTRYLDIAGTTRMVTPRDYDWMPQTPPPDTSATTTRTSRAKTQAASTPQTEESLR